MSLMLRFQAISKRHYSPTRSEGRRIVDSLRKQYEEKRLEHINAAERDKANILTMNQAPFTFEYTNKIQEGIYGLGYTSPKEV